MPELNYIATVYNGIEINRFSYVDKPQDDILLFVGRIDKKKGPKEAIEVAKKLGKRLVMAAAVDPIEQAYFDREIAPLVDNKQISILGELDPSEIAKLYARATATLYPISWHEPFGLVMVESMAAGTPVVAFDIGAASEVIEHGKTGFVVPPKNGVDGLAQAVGQIGSINRADCRARVEAMFTSDRMVDAYQEVYQRVIKG